MWWNVGRLQGSPVWHCSLSWHWSRWTWRSTLWLSALLPRSWFACEPKNPPKKHSHFTGAALTYMALTHLQCLIHNIWLWTVCHTVSLPGLFCSRQAWWWRHFLSLSWRRQSTLKSAGKSWHLWRADVLKAWCPCATMLLQHSNQCDSHLWCHRPPQPP